MFELHESDLDENSSLIWQHLLGNGEFSGKLPESGFSNAHFHILTWMP